jgi:plastocyanin
MAHSPVWCYGSPAVWGRGVFVAALGAALAVSPTAAARQEPQGPGPTVAATSGNQFFPRSLTVPPNTTVYWENRGLNHNVKFEDGLFEQPADPLATPWRVWRHFDNEGTFRYFCEAHGGPGGAGMSGVVVVAANASPVLASLKATPRRVCKRRTRRCRRTTAVVTFSLSEAAKVSGGVDPDGAPAGREGIDISVDGKAGKNRLKIPVRPLAPGLYKLTLAAEDADGNESDPAVVRFRVVRPRR